MRVEIKLFVITSMMVVAPLTMAINNSTDNNSPDRVSSNAGLEAGTTAVPATEATGHDYPQWPKRNIYQRSNQIPPPPPGPYMSSAMSNVGTGFPGTVNKQSVKPVRPIMEPYPPWPERQRPPSGWVPENGTYQFAPQRPPSGAIPGQFDGRNIVPMLQPQYYQPERGRY